MGKVRSNWLEMVKFELFLLVIAVVTAVLSFFPKVVGLYTSLWLWYLSPIISTIIIWRCIAKVLRKGKVKPVGRLFEFLFFFTLFLSTYTLSFILANYNIRIMAWVFEISVISAGYSGWLHYMEGFYDEKKWWKPPKKYNLLSKSDERGRNMWNRIRKYGVYKFIGNILVTIGAILLFSGFYMLITNNDTFRWSDLVSLGVGSISIGIALMSLNISRVSREISNSSDRKLTRLTTAELESLISEFEDQRFYFIERVNREQPDRFSVEAFVWKSRVYFNRAVALREWVEKSKFNRLIKYFDILVDIVMVQSIRGDWRNLVWNRDVNNIVSMFIQLLETGIIDTVPVKMKNHLLNMFKEQIGTRIPREKNITWFKRVKDELSKRDPNTTFEHIGM